MGSSLVALKLWKGIVGLRASNVCAVNPYSYTDPLFTSRFAGGDLPQEFLGSPRISEGIQVLSNPQMVVAAMPSPFIVAVRVSLLPLNILFFGPGCIIDFPQCTKAIHFSFS